MKEKLSIQDSIKLWFNTLKLQGEDTNIRFFRKKLSENNLEEFLLDHSEYDGISGIEKLLSIHEPELLQLNHSIPKRRFPKSILIWMSFFRYCSTLPFYSAGWKIKNDNWISGQSYGTCKSYDYYIFTKEETRQILEKSSNNNVKPMSLILYTLDRVISGYTKKSFFSRNWLIPVSLRGFETKQKTDNITGFFDLKLSNQVNLNTCNKKLLKKIKRGDAFGGFRGVTLGAIIGPYLVKVLVVINNFLQVRTGVLTNLGVWGRGVESDNIWFGLPPVIKTQPVGAMTVTVFDQMVIAIQVHPRLSVEPRLASEIVDSWKSQLLEEFFV